MSILLGFGMPGPLELFVIALVLLLLFGNRLPSVMRSLGRGVVEFKRGVQGLDDDLESTGKSIDKEKDKEKID